MQVYINATVFWERMSNGILEAMACGLSVIASNIYTNRIWLYEPENALLFAAKDRKELANHMVYLYKNEGG